VGGGLRVELLIFSVVTREVCLACLVFFFFFFFLGVKECRISQSLCYKYRKEGTYVARYRLGREVGLVVLGL
jgi:hypothetical protein